MILICKEPTSVTTHFEKLRTLKKKFQSALNLGRSQRTLKKKIFFFQSALIWGILKHFEKKIENHILHG